jgi:hypothetical protein
MASRGMSIQEKMEYAVNQFGSIGIGREASMGILGSLAGESGRNLNTNAHNPKDPNGGSVGIAQWHSDRRTNMENFSSKWGSPKDFRHQVDFIVHELKTNHKNVADKLRDPDITRSKATTTWTREYERPAKAYEHLGTRKENAAYFANMAAPDRPKGPQEVVDRTSPGNKAMAAIEAATRDVGKVGVTGASVGKNSAATAYVDPFVSAPNYDAAKAGAKGPSTQSNPSAGPMESVFGGIANAIGGVASGVSGFATGINNMDVMGAFAAMGGSAEQNAKNAAYMAERAGEKTQQAAASAKSGIGGFMAADANTGAYLGAMVGGYFGGPIGAVLGGLAGQGINKALDGIAGQKKQEDVEKKAETGIAGGVGRAIDNLFGGAGSGSGWSGSSAANPNGVTVDSRGFPSAPSGGNWGGGGGFSDADYGAASDWASSNPDVASTPGMY